jgi:competence protein ComEA
VQGSPRLGAAGLIVSALAIAALAAGRQVPNAALERAPVPPRVAVAALREGAAFDINAAAASDFALLPGVGPKLAARIVAERTRRGGFHDLADLQDVRGIGAATYARIRAFVSVSSTAQRSTNKSPDNMSVK